MDNFSFLQSLDKNPPKKEYQLYEIVDSDKKYTIGILLNLVESFETYLKSSEKMNVDDLVIKFNGKIVTNN